MHHFDLYRVIILTEPVSILIWNKIQEVAMVQTYHEKNGVDAFVAAGLSKSKVSNKIDPNIKIEVIGSGVGRTGTSSLKKAIEILYGHPCYHMAEVFKTGSFNFWTRASNKEKISPEEYKKELRGYVGVTDNPASMMWEELLEVYPDAKVVLAERDPESWYASVKESIMNMSPLSSYWGIRVIMNTVNRPMGRLICATWGKWSGNYGLIGLKDYETNKQRMIDYYLKYNEDVKKRCPSDKLLLLNLKDGWAPLCAHLNRPIPDVPFPHENDTKEMKKIINTMNIAGWVISIVLFPIVGIIMTFFPIKPTV